MFTGIIETIGILKNIQKNKENLIFEIQSKISKTLKPDQSVSHNGVCLTITKTKQNTHYVTVIAETISKTNFGKMVVGDFINLERAVQLGQRLDGHLVSGHIDTSSKVIQSNDHQGSLELVVRLEKEFKNLVIEKGSITLNGISLTISKIKKKSFSVFIIPYTLSHTNLKSVKPGDSINIEFDLIGKYIQRIFSK